MTTTTSCSVTACPSYNERPRADVSGAASGERHGRGGHSMGGRVGSSLV
jgi:hypothetical protein